MTDESSASSQKVDLKHFATSTSVERNSNNSNGANDSAGSSIGQRRVVIGARNLSLVVDDDKLSFPCLDESSNGAANLSVTQGDDSATEEPSFNLRLIEAVRQSRCLYDASDRQYRSADHKIKVWNRLVQALGFQGDARTLYNRWKQLRDKYGKEKKKMKYNGDISQWQFFKHLEFLDPHMVDRTQQKFERTKDGKLIYKEVSRPIVITDPNFALHLINEVRLQPCLFDIKDSKYRHTEYRNQAWSEIIKNLDFPGDINAIYKQWKKIRDRYVREKRKIRMSANGEHEEPSWELYRELLWIDPFLEERAAQVKRKRESSEMSDDLYMDDFKYEVSGRSSDVQQEQQQYTMVMQTPVNHNRVQHLSTSKIHSQPSTSGLQSDNTRQIRTTATAPPISTATAILANGTTLMMQPVLASAAQNIATATTAQLTVQPHHQAQQHVIITNEPLDGDRAFALSVAADLSALPEHARNMARAQIQHLLENSKITIVKA